MRTVSLSATLLLALAAGPALAGEEPAAPSGPPAPAAPPAESPAPEGPAAVVHGKPLPRSAFHEALARRFLRGDGGEKLVEKLLMDFAARKEQARRGVVVSEEDVLRSVDDTRIRLAEQMARSGMKVAGPDPLESSLKEAGSTLSEFVDETRNFLALQAMAREDLGARGEVPLAQVEVWLRELLRKSGATAEPSALKPGEAARIGGEPVSMEKAGRWLARNVRHTDRLGTALDLAFGIWVEDRASAAGASLSAAEVDAEIARLQREFGRQPGIEGTGVAFEEWLRDVKGLSLEEYRRDPSFRAALLARKVAAADVPEGKVRKEWEENPGLYGETARVRRLVVRGEERATAFGSSARPMAEARAIADRALEEIRGGKAFEAVARKYSEDFAPEGPRGQPVELAAGSNTTRAPQPVMDAVFKAKEGELLGPVRAVDGWYLVLVEKRTPAPTYEQCAARVRDDLVARAVAGWRLALKSDPEVRIAADI